MKVLALLLSTLALAAATIEWDDLVVTWRTPSSDPERLNSFFSIPRTLDDAVSEGWVNARIKQSLKVKTYCMPDDPRFCVMFNSANYIAGVQIGTIVSDVEDTQRVYSMARTNYNRIKTMFNRRVWTSVAWTQNPTALKSRGYPGPWNNLTGTEGVWFETTNGYVEVPRNLTDLDPVWTEQACVPTMGTHYYYDMYNTTACENMKPWFLLFQNQTLTGVGHMVFGTSSELNRTWNDVIPAEPNGIRVAAPRGPQCLYDSTTTYGLTSRHVFFTAEPWTITSCA